MYCNFNGLKSLKTFENDFQTLFHRVSPYFYYIYIIYNIYKKRKFESLKRGEERMEKRKIGKRERAPPSNSSNFSNYF